MPTYAEAIEAVERLNLDEQEDLLETVRRRLAEKRRTVFIVEVEEARAEVVAGGLGCD